jgi:hypothetical protein
LWFGSLQGEHAFPGDLVPVLHDATANNSRLFPNPLAKGFRLVVADLL